ncbi:MAG: hypothetical protein K5756_00240 [Clostridiales bacterium]|nr:hypothetical protein [Clostridiales bacterium]
MNTSTENYIENLLKLSLTAENEPEIRNGLQDIITRTGHESGGLQSKTLRDCYRKLRRLQNFCISSRKEKSEGICDLNELLDELGSAGDILLDLKNRGVAFLPCETELFVNCHPSELTAVVLNMLSNACVHSRTPVIDMSLKKMGDNAVITVKNDGKINFEMLAKSLKDQGSGAAAMLNFANRHGSRLMWCAGYDCTTVLSMPAVTEKDKKIRCCQTPDFSDLLRDKLSPVYVGLCDALDGIIF